MNLLRLTSLLLLAAFLQGSYVDDNTCDITINVTGIQNTKGQLMISLHLGSDGFPYDKMYKQVYITDFTSPTTSIVFKNVPYGNGALSMLHDENKSGDMDFNFIHIPKEGFGFYRDYNVIFRSPKYEEISFDISEPTMEVELKVKY